MSNPDSLQLRIVAPPPVIYICALLLGFAIHTLLPIAIFTTTHGHQIIGGFLLVVSVAFARWAFVTMRQAGTSANPYKSSAALTIAGPFRYSRNPIYVAMTGLYLGLAFFLNAAWLLMLLVPLLLFMYWGVIRREERYLLEKFGDVYTSYQSRVRRWL